MEVWRDIPGYENHYQVSNLGKVKRKEGFIRKGKKMVLSIQREKILSQSDNGNGYKGVSLCKNNIQKRFHVHQLVAMAFLNHNPCKFKLVIDHINHEKSDNRVENLRVVTNRENSINKDTKYKYTSKYTGVYFFKRNNKWGAVIRNNGNQEYLGRFKTEIEAHNAYQKRLNEIL